MANIVPGSDSFLFRSKEDIVDHLLCKVLANKNRYIGTEWEMFLIKSDGLAITRPEGQKAFEELKSVFELRGYTASCIYEQDAAGNHTTFGLDVNELGIVTPEMGHQFEFSCSVCEDSAQVREKNEEFYSAICEVAVRVDCIPVFKGHVPGYVESTEGSYRSRSVEWRNYFYKRFGADSMSVREALDGTASTQVTIDSGADKFHEFFKALLLIEPALTLHYANSDRHNIGVCRLPQAHMKPIVDVWEATNPRDALEIIVDRFMEVDVPFLPDPQRPDIYKAEPLTSNRPPTMKDLMEKGRLDEKALNNIGGFLLSRPALRKFSKALLELRGVDSQPTPDKVAEITRRIIALIYDDAAREKLLTDYSYLCSLDIQALHDISSMPERHGALSLEVARTKMGSFMEDIILRSENGRLSALAQSS